MPAVEPRFPVVVRTRASLTRYLPAVFHTLLGEGVEQVTRTHHQSAYILNGKQFGGPSPRTAIAARGVAGRHVASTRELLSHQRLDEIDLRPTGGLGDLDQLSEWTVAQP